MSRRADILIPVGLLVIAFAIYGASLDASFQMDDTNSIVENHAVSSGDLVGAAKFWPGRALVYLSFALQVKSFGLSPTALRSVNVLSHALAAAALFWLLYGLLRASVPERDPRIAAGLAALFFLMHPLQTQAVTYIVQRASSWAALFSLVALAAQSHAWARPATERRWRVLAYGAALTAMFCKEWAIALPLVMIFVEHLLGPGNSARRQLVPALLLLSVVPLTAALGGNFGDAGSSSLLAETVKVSRGHYFLTQAEVLTRYLGLLLWPVGQNIDHDIAWRSELLSTMPWFLPQLLIVGVGILAWRRSHPVSALAILGACAFALPESSLFPIADPMFEHRMYMPMFGASILFGLAVARLIQMRRRTAWVSALLLLALLGWRTVERNQLWQTPETLWRDAVAKSPEKSRPRLGLGVALAKRGDFRSARRELEKAVELRPTSARAWTNLGNIQLTQEENDSAVASLERAVQLNSEYAPAWYNLGVARNRRREWPAAGVAFAKAVELRPHHAAAWNSLASVQLRMGDKRGAAQSARRAAELGSPAPRLIRAIESSP